MNAIDRHYAQCNLCSGDDAAVITVQNGFRVVQCNRCSLVYVNPRPSPAQLIKAYNEYHQREGKDEHTWDALMAWNYRQTAGLLNGLLPGKGRLLDIGCGYGHFLERMEREGWNTFGIDPSSRTIAYAREKGLKVEENTIDGFAETRNAFDAITAFYVLEHLFDPLGALRKMFTIIKPGGVLALRVPNTTPLVKLLSLFRIKNDLYDAPFHLYDFSPGTLTRLMRKAGFAGIRVIPGRPTLPAAPGERIVSVVSGLGSQLLFSLTGGAFLLPGASMTVLAAKPLHADTGGE